MPTLKTTVWLIIAVTMNAGLLTTIILSRHHDIPTITVQETTTNDRNSEEWFNPKWGVNGSPFDRWWFKSRSYTTRDLMGRSL